jgi:hypothetical protein
MKLDVGFEPRHSRHPQTLWFQALTVIGPVFARFFVTQHAAFKPPYNRLSFNPKNRKRRDGFTIQNRSLPLV